MKTIKITTIVCLLLVCSAQAKSQVQYGGKAWSQKYNISFNNIADTTLPILGKNDANTKDTSGTYYLGPSRPIDVDIMSQGTRTVIDSDVIILYRIKSLGTNAMFVIFDKFILSNTTKIFFHYDDSITKGCYKNLNVANFPEKKFSGPFIVCEAWLTALG
jgi:hypothetical protein